MLNIPGLEGRPQLPPELQPAPYTREHYTERFRRHFVNGFPDGTFRPDSDMTRAEMMQVFFNISNPSPANLVGLSSTRFSDVDTNEWYFMPIAYLESRGLIAGFPDGTVRPNDPITNAEFASMATRFFNLGNIIAADMLLEAESHWGANYINLGFAHGWFAYFGIAETFRPDTPIPRAQAVALLNFYTGRVPCPTAVNAFLARTGSNIFPDLPRGHWSFYEVMEAAFSRYYHLNTNHTETWTRVIN